MSDIEKFRHATATAHKKMAGCMEHSFLCKKCRTKKSVAGRKHIIPGAPKFGFICKECAA